VTDGRAVLAATNHVLKQYDGQVVTVRQLYYRLISDPFNLFPNTRSRYTLFDRWLVGWRESGVVEWERIADHSRAFVPGEDYASPGPKAFLASLLERLSDTYYHRRRWAEQEVTPEVWVEKDALAGVVGDAVRDLRVGVFPSRGYSSLTKLKEAIGRLTETPHAIIYLSDHDPSGLGMEADLRRRLAEYGASDVPIDRVALTTAQVRKHRLAPNPVKRADSRAGAYVAEFGASCWELDALPPQELRRIVRRAVARFVDKATWAATEAREQEESDRISGAIAGAREALESALESFPDDDAEADV
jgi:hypothetical protein